jgi:Fur family iron response transcriptional regulator
MNGPLISPDAISSLLRGLGVNTTYPRLRIAELIMTRREHLSAEQVFGIVNQARLAGVGVPPSATRSTCSSIAALLQTVTSQAGVTLYYPNTEPHLHLHDLESDTLHDIPLEVLDGFPLETIASGFRVERIDLTLRVRKAEIAAA